MIDVLNAVFSFVEIIGIIVTLGLTVYTLRQNTCLALKEQKSEILTQKRSQRIDLLRTFSSTILAEGELKLLDKEINYSSLTYATNNYASLLQYIHDYTEDIELITLAHAVERAIIEPTCDKTALKELLNRFYFRNDHYIAVEYSRLIQEVESRTLDINSIEMQKKAFEEQERMYQALYQKTATDGTEVIL